MENIQIIPVVTEKANGNNLNVIHCLSSFTLSC